MKSVDTLRQLQSSDWRSIDVSAYDLNTWIAAAKPWANPQNKEESQMFHRIQCLVVEAGLISNQEFMDRTR